MPTAWKTQVDTRFGKASPHYDQYCDVQKSAAQTLYNYLPNLEKPSILEIGCGTGYLVKLLKNKYKNATYRITDINPSMVEMAKKQTDAQNVTFAVMDGENPDTENTYDLIIANMAFQWFEDHETALKKLTALLNTGGQILYSAPGPNSFQEWKDTLENLSLPSGIINLHTPPEIFHEENYIEKYESAREFLLSMKNIGAHNPNKTYRPLTPAQLKTACRTFDETHQGRITWHIQYGRITA